jgi:purine-nucleoside/S-methyl-5'-thioadenosine phosphorylase / adenosine deaminase
MVTLLPADWPVPPHVTAFSTTRLGGASSGHYHSFNLALHVGDQPAAVRQNRALLKLQQRLPQQPAWLNQQHTASTVAAEHVTPDITIADASYTSQPKLPCAVLTADCLPIFLCNTQGTQIAAIHGGWRGLYQGIIAQTIQRLHSPADDLLAWLGPAICARHYEVSDILRTRFVRQDPSLACAFHYTGSRLTADLYQIARQQLHQQGIKHIYGGHSCTYQDPRFYSYRRDGAATGRMASIIWLQ